MLKLVILDRDGVINYDSDDYVKSPEEWHAIPGSLEAIAKLNKAGYKVAIATNQSGIGRGYYTQETFEKITEKMFSEMKKVGAHVDALFYCPHHPDDKCECRKPKPGLLLTIADFLKIDIKDAIMIGDTEKDLGAADAVGIGSIIVGEDGDVPDLAHAVELILNLKTDFDASRFKKSQLKSELLAKAVGIKKDYIPSVLDLSAGLGSDGYLLYQLGCPITLVERSKLVFILLKLNLSFADIPIYNMDSRDYLKKLDNKDCPDVIYFDPIFPEKTKTALSKKSSRLLKQVVGDDLDAAEVFELALKKAKKRVVIKRPKYAKTITDKKPDVVFEGKAVRFDVYLTPKVSPRA